MPPPGRDHGERVDRKPQSEAENFIQCPLCGGFVDIRYLAQVLEHEGSLPRGNALSRGERAGSEREDTLRRLLDV